MHLKQSRTGVFLQEMIQFISHFLSGVLSAEMEGTRKYSQSKETSLSFVENNCDLYNNWPPYFDYGN